MQIYVYSRVFDDFRAFYQFSRNWYQLFSKVKKDLQKDLFLQMFALFQKEIRKDLLKRLIDFLSIKRYFLGFLGDFEKTNFFWNFSWFFIFFDLKNHVFSKDLIIFLEKLLACSGYLFFLSFITLRQKREKHGSRRVSTFQSRLNQKILEDKKVTAVLKLEKKNPKRRAKKKQHFFTNFARSKVRAFNGPLGLFYIPHLAYGKKWTSQL